MGPDLDGLWEDIVFSYSTPNLSDATETLPAMAAIAQQVMPWLRRDTLRRMPIFADCEAA